jgi:negative regulator of flagellin synthesis FlgM
MKISSEKSPIDLMAYVRNTENQDRETPKVKGGLSETPQEEKVQLSSEAKDVQKAREILNSVPEIREEKVEPLKEKVEAGTYDVRGEKVAEKMLLESLIDVLL